MMALYKNTGPVDCTQDFDRSKVKGKTAIVTGGSSGIGLAYAKALSEAGAQVVLGDIDEKAGAEAAQKFSNTKFIRCDVTSWDDQVALFTAALDFSPHRAIDYVIANAGIAADDDILTVEDAEIPSQPSLKTTQINIIGVMYTSKLAFHHFRRQHAVNSSRDTCLILQGSLAGYLDMPGSPQYGASKSALRGLLHSFRQTFPAHGSRVLYIAPWFIDTAIINAEYRATLVRLQTEFASADDAAEAALKFFTDKSINGRSLAIVPRSWQPRGYVDIDDDDYTSAKHWLGAIVEKSKMWNGKNIQGSKADNSN